MKTKNKILNGLWVVGVLLMAGFCLSACTTELDIQKAYPFSVDIMPIPKEIAPNETVEIRCTLTPEGNFDKARYTLRFFQYDGLGTLQIGKEGSPLIPNDRYEIESGDFNLYYTSTSDERQSIEVVIEDNNGQAQVLEFNFSSKKG